MVDLLAAVRRPLESLPRDCPFSKWESLALFLDDGATEVVRWAGGVTFVLEELGISTVLDLQVFAPGRGQVSRVPPRKSEIERGVFLLTTFLWDAEAAVLNAARAYGLEEVVVACSVSEAGHSCHPHAMQLTEDSGGVVSFEEMGQQLKISLDRMLKIEAQSRLKPLQTPTAGTSGLPSSPLGDPRPVHPPVSQAPAQPDVMVSVIHSPLHVGAFLQNWVHGQQGKGIGKGKGKRKENMKPPPGASAFVLGSPECSRAFPLRPCDLRMGGLGLGLGEAGVEGGGGGKGPVTMAGADSSGLGLGTKDFQVVAGDVPRRERLRYRLLSQTLSELLWDQLLLDVCGGVFTLGPTSHLLGSTLAEAVEELKGAKLEAESVAAMKGAIRGSGEGTTQRQAASLVIVDRTLDLAAPTSREDNLLQRVLSMLPRTGTPPAPTGNPSFRGGPGTEPCSGLSQLHLHDVGVRLDALSPGLGIPAAVDGRDTLGEGPGAGAGERLGAMKALRAFEWPAPPSLCHAGDKDAMGVVHGMGCQREGEAHRRLVEALERCVYAFQCTPPPPKRRGMGAAIMALLTSLAGGSSKEGGLSGNQVCLRCRGLVQVSLAAMEAHQRSAAQSGSPWPELIAAERVQGQLLRDGASGDVLMDQACEMLEGAKLTAVWGGGGGDEAHPTTVASVPVSDTLLLALRGVSLGGGGVGTTRANQFQQAFVHRMMAGGFSERGAGVPEALSKAVAGLARLCGREREEEEAGVCLGLEDIAHERFQHLRETAAYRRHLKTPVLRDLGTLPYEFVAGRGTERGGSSSSNADGWGDEDWDDWGDDEEEEDGQVGSSKVGCTGSPSAVECRTLVGRLVGLMLDQTSPGVPDLREAKVMSATSVGLGLLSSGLKKFAGITATPARRARPSDRPVVLVFVLGGLAPHEFAEVSRVQCAAAGGKWGGGEGVPPQILLAGTTLLTPDIIYKQVFSRPGANEEHLGTVS